VRMGEELHRVHLGRQQHSTRGAGPLPAGGGAVVGPASPPRAEVPGGDRHPLGHDPAPPGHRDRHHHRQGQPGRQDNPCQGRVGPGDPEHGHEQGHQRDRDLPGGERAEQVLVLGRGELVPQRLPHGRDPPFGPGPGGPARPSPGGPAGPRGPAGPGVEFPGRPPPAPAAGGPWGAEVAGGVGCPAATPPICACLVATACPACAAPCAAAAATGTPQPVAAVAPPPPPAPFRLEPVAPAWASRPR
jgi:hypothetical protein